MAPHAKGDQVGGDGQRQSAATVEQPYLVLRQKPHRPTLQPAAQDVGINTARWLR
jgi:hypothetical protein